ncbi:hypothetical protein niasHS_014221 [Heterodera schachtii]|uniref:Homeobox domain-containing protein n=1 Tax=Heterodera schachtii TaxID=97005 RepID=A0ABD2I6K1_HETSC
MRFPPKIQLPPELLFELANAFRFDFHWSVLRVSSSIFDHFLAKRQQKILQNIELKFQQLHEQHGGSDNVGQKLAKFQNKISLPISNVSIHEAVVAAHILISVHTGNFNHLYAFLESHKFVRQIHPKLQKIWWYAHFLEAEKTQGKSELSPLEKYKVREKYPLPPTIWDGQRKNGFFSENTITLLNEQFIRKNYLSQADRWELAEATGLSTAQIGNWLKNQRMKEKKAWRAERLAYFAKMSADELEEKKNELWVRSPRLKNPQFPILEVGVSPISDAMRFPPKLPLPNELLSELANAFRFDFRWSVLRVSSSIFDHFLAKRQQKILQNVDLNFKKHFRGHLHVPMHEAVLAARTLNKYRHIKNPHRFFSLIRSTHLVIFLRCSAPPMDCSSKIQLPPELLSELANAFRFDFRWSVLRVSCSIFDHFLAKRQQKILKIVDLKVQQIINMHGGLDNIRQKLANFQNQISLSMSNVPIHEAVVAAHVLISVDTGNFNELYAFLESHKFVRQIHPKLQKIWWDVHFLEAEQTLGARSSWDEVRIGELSPLQKYIVREKHPLPPTIWEKNGFFKENEARQVGAGGKDRPFADAG